MTLGTSYFRHFALFSTFVAVPDWIWFVFIFIFGCCIGSFLNVVIYRLPRDKSIITPPSACPECGKHIPPYDNIPLVSWLVLGRKCRFCKAPISPRYFMIELLTGSIFLGLFIIYFRTGLVPDMRPFLAGGWFIYLLHIILLAAFIAASAIDLELWVIPLCICWFVTAAGFVASTLGFKIIDPTLIHAHMLLPQATAKTGALAAGAVIGLAISIVLLATGLIKRSYETEDGRQTTDDTGHSEGQKPALSEAEGTEDPSSPEGLRSTSEEQRTENGGQRTLHDPKSPTLHSSRLDEASRSPNGDGAGYAGQAEGGGEQKFNHRIEACKEILFLLPIIVFSVAVLRVIGERSWWLDFSQHPAIAGLLGSLWGYFVGCATVWAIRIFGTFAFGKEAMGLGDVHLMGAAGAVIGPIFVVVAFFIAPFFGLAWAGCQMFFKKIRQIPYGPFLSLGVFVVMILHDRIRDYVKFILEPLVGNW